MKTLKVLFTWCLFFVGVSLPCRSYGQGQTLPYYTGFDTPQEKAGWVQYRLGYLSTYGWGASSSLSHDYNVGGASTQTVVDWYVSPPLNCPDGAKISFKRQAGGFSSPTPDNCEVYFSDSKADPALGTYTLVGNISSVTVQYAWQDTLLDIPFKTDSGYIAFKYKTIGAAWMTYEIDSIWIKAKPSTVGVGEESNVALSLNVFPNPLSEESEVVFNRPLNAAVLALYDMRGTLMYSQKEISGDRIKIGPKDLLPGVYLLEVSGPSLTPLRKKVLVSD